MRFVYPFILLSMLAGCSSPSEEHPHSFRIYEEDGVTVAETSGGPKYRDDLFIYETVCTLKEDPSNLDSYLYGVTNYWIDEDGFFYVADSGNQRIAVFGPEGDYLRSFGREGEGPGEFRSLRIQSLQQDVLSLWDSRTHRATLYSTDGILVEVLTPPRSIRADEYRRDLDGYLYLFSSRSNEDERFLFTGVEVTVFSPEEDTLSVIQTPTIESLHTFQFQDRSGDMVIPYSGEPEILILDNGLLLLSTGVESRLDLFNRTGKPARIIRLALPSEPVSSSERQAIQDSLRSMVVRAPDIQAREIYKAVLEAVYIPEYKAFWSGVQVDSYGYIWLQYPLSHYRISIEDGKRYRVLSPEGEYLGDTVAPFENGRVLRGMYLTWKYDEVNGLRLPTVFLIRPAVDGLVYP